MRYPVIKDKRLRHDIRALNGLCTADRILVGCLGDLVALRTRQTFDIIDLLPLAEDGLLGEQDRGTIESVNNRLLEAHNEYRQAIARLDAHTAADIVPLGSWSALEGILDMPLFDYMVLKVIKKNIATIRTFQREVRRVFNTVRDADPRLTKRVRPLYISKSEGIEEMLGRGLGVNPEWMETGQLVLTIVGIVAFIVNLLFILT